MEKRRFDSSKSLKDIFALKETLSTYHKVRLAQACVFKFALIHVYVRTKATNFDKLSSFYLRSAYVAML